MVELNLTHRSPPSCPATTVHAVLLGKKAAVKYLLKKGADATIGEKDGYTPMHGAGFQGAFRLRARAASLVNWCSSTRGRGSRVLSISLPPPRTSLPLRQAVPRSHATSSTPGSRIRPSLGTPTATLPCTALAGETSLGTRRPLSRW